MSTPLPTIVIGGGISGLVCAHAVREAGIEAQVIEASERPGGVIQSVRREGYLLELGPQSFTATAPLKKLCNELGVAQHGVEAPAGVPRYIVARGKLEAAPLSPPAFFGSKLFGGSTKWSVIRDVFGKSVPPEGDESVADFVRRKFSAELLDQLVGPFVSGIYAGDPEKLSARSAFPMLHEAERAAGSIVRGMIRKAKQGPRERATLMSFRDGNETLIGALAAKLGGALRTKATATRIARGRDGAFEVSVQVGGSAEVLRAPNVVLATPTSVAGRLLAATMPEFEILLSGIEYAPVAVVSIGYAKKQVARSLEGFGFLIPRSAGLRTLGTVWNSSLFPGRAPEGFALLTSFAGGMTDPQAGRLSAEELTAVVHGEIGPLLGVQGQPAFANVQKHERAIPQYNLGHQARLEKIETLRKRQPGLWFAGNYLRGPAMGACVEQALAVAGEIRIGYKT